MTKLIALILIIGITMVAMVDAWEYEMTGECQGCVLLGGYFEGRNND